MADGLNEARAMRVTEIISDFRNLQHYIAQINAAPSAEEYYLEGYTMLRQCTAEAQAVLAQPFAAIAGNPGGSPEREKEQLRSVILDAASRRFQCHRTYLRATAAMRWINSRNSVLRGQKPHAGHLPALQTIDATFRQELASITDENVEYALRAQDAAEEKWLDDDPSLASIQQMIHSRYA